jgi:hypothetical protein
MAELRQTYSTVLEDLKGIDYLRDPDIDGRIILKCIKK